MDCPVCIEPMQAVEFFNVSVETCRFCGGVWLEKGEIGKFIKQGTVPRRILTPIALDDSRKRAKEGERLCPSCSKTLDLIVHRGVKVDYCSYCNGFWFDRSELLEILKSYRFTEKHREEIKEACELLAIANEEELFRINDDKYKKYIPSHAAADEDASSNIVVFGPLEREILEGGTEEDVIKAISRSAPKDSQSPNTTGANPFGTVEQTLTFPVFSNRKDFSFNFGDVSHCGDVFDVGDLIISFITSLLNPYDTR